jgi:hypothetical protein
MCKEARRACSAQPLPSPRSRRDGYGVRRAVVDPTPPPDPLLSLSGPARFFSRTQQGLTIMHQEARRARIAQPLGCATGRRERQRAVVRFEVKVPPCWRPALG